MSLIQASVTATAAVVDFSNNLATTLHLRESDRAGTALTAHATNNYLNFVVSVSEFTDRLNIAAVTADASGVSDASDISNALNWSYSAGFGSACSLYDVRFTSSTNNHGAIRIMDFLNIDQTGNVNEPEVTFSGTGVTGGSSSDAGVLDASSGSVELDCGVASESSTTAITPSVKVNYSVADSVLLVAVKEDNILAQDSIAFGTAVTVDGTGADVLKDSTSFGALDGSNNVTGSITNVSIPDHVVTAAVQRLLTLPTKPTLLILTIFPVSELLLKA